MADQGKEESLPLEKRALGLFLLIIFLTFYWWIVPVSVPRL